MTNDGLFPHFRRRPLFLRAWIVALGVLPSLGLQAATTTLSVAPAAIPAGAAPSTFNFPVTRSGDATYEAFVRYHTVDGTAVAGVDYTAVAGRTSIPAGATSVSIPIPISADASNGAAKTFDLVLDGATGVGATPSFSAAQILHADHRPYSITIADLNGDGKPDLLVPNFVDGTVFVRINTSAPGATTATFTDVQTFTVGDGPSSIAVADVNGDSRPDIVVTNGLGGTLSVLLNTGSADPLTVGFAPQQTFPTGGRSPQVVSADVNGDGKPDMLVADSQDDTLSVLINSTVAGATTAAFLPRQIVAVGDAPFSLTAPDLNGDGRPDVVTANFNDNTISVMLNTTPPGGAVVTFTQVQTFAVGTEPMSMASADFNGDGRADIAVANLGSQNVSVLLNNTAVGAAVASFSEPATLATEVNPIGIGASDLNGDGKPDLVVAHSGTSTLSLIIDTTTPGADIASFKSPVFLPSALDPRAVAFADLNGDGLPDVVASLYADVAVILNTSTPVTSAGFDDAHAFPALSQSTMVIATDINGDGRPDVMSLGNDGAIPSLSALVNSTQPGALLPDFATSQSFATGQSPESIAAGDFNGDGRQDLIVANSGSNTFSVFGNTTTPGAIVASFSNQQSFATGTVPQSILAQDMDGDGKADVVAANRLDDTISVFANTTTPGSSTFAFGAGAVFVTGHLPAFVASGDLDGDGRPDIVTSNIGDNTLSILVNTTVAGSGVPDFALPLTLATKQTPGEVAIADLNGDGRGDVIVVSDSVSVFINTTAPGATTPTFASEQVFGSGPQALGAFPGSFLTATDVNGDGKPDVIVANFANGTASLLLDTTVPGSQVAGFAPQPPFAVGATPQSAALADVNGDGRPDLIVSNAGLATISVLLNTQYRAVISGSFATGTIDSGLIFANGFD